MRCIQRFTCSLGQEVQITERERELTSLKKRKIIRSSQKVVRIVSAVLSGEIGLRCLLWLIVTGHCWSDTFAGRLDTKSTFPSGSRHVLHVRSPGVLSFVVDLAQNTS